MITLVCQGESLHITRQHNNYYHPLLKISESKPMVDVTAWDRETGGSTPPSSTKGRLETGENRMRMPMETYLCVDCTRERTRDNPFRVVGWGAMEVISTWLNNYQDLCRLNYLK